MIKAGLENHSVKEVMAASTMQIKWQDLYVNSPVSQKAKKSKSYFLSIFKWGMSSGGILSVKYERKRRNRRHSFFQELGG